MNRYGVIFDMDGVLVDSYQAHFESWNRMAARHGLEMTERQFAETFGRTSREIIRELWSEHVTEAQIGDWDAEKEAAYRQVLRASFPEMDGAGALLAALAEAGFALAIGSSGPPQNVAVVLECLPNAAVFAATVNGTEVARGKPEPEVFLAAAGKLGLEADRCAVIEDAPAGVEAARRAGMVAIALTGTAPREQLAPRAHVVIDSLRELSPETIARLIDGLSDGR